MFDGGKSHDGIGGGGGVRSPTTMHISSAMICEARHRNTRAGGNKTEAHMMHTLPYKLKAAREAPITCWEHVFLV